MTLWVGKYVKDGRTFQHVWGQITEPGELELVQEAMGRTTVMVSSDGADMNGHTIIHNHLYEGHYVAWTTEVDTDFWDWVGGR